MELSNEELNESTEEAKKMTNSQWNREAMLVVIKQNQALIELGVMNARMAENHKDKLNVKLDTTKDFEALEMEHMRLCGE